MMIQDKILHAVVASFLTYACIVTLSPPVWEGMFGAVVIVGFATFAWEGITVYRYGARWDWWDIVASFVGIILTIVVTGVLT